jgi:hypothetical protein
METSTNKLSTIFVAIPSLYDTELVPTILNCFKAAEHPERVVLGVSLMDSNTKFLKFVEKNISKYSTQIKLKFTKLTYKNADTVLNVGYGRKQASDLYGGEDYFLQCDSHSLFSEGWDSQLISLHSEATEELGFDKVILTAYAGRYGYIDGVRQPFPGDCGTRYPFYTTKNWLSEYIPSWVDKVLAKEEKFLPCSKFNANFAFGDWQFAENTGVFEKAVFFEEEPVQSINLLDQGFKLVFPVLDRSPVCHLYATPDSHKGFGFRRTGYSYLSPRQMETIKARNWVNWRDFVYNPDNFDKVRKYELYCGTSMRYGVCKPDYIPEYY